jgi:phosphatidylserine decarboxylase
LDKKGKLMHITNKISKIFDKFANKEFSKPIQNIINKGYVKILGLDMSEFDKPESYKTLNKLFTRKFVENREIDNTKDAFISPADSFVTQQGKIEDYTALQIKGMQYDINELFTTKICSENIDKIKNGDFMNFYLSPKDYHRYHSPYDLKIKKLVYVPGKLYPVNFKYLKKQENLFIENERVILECEFGDKLIYLVFVGALNVGKMVFDFEPEIVTNDDTSSIQVFNYDNLSVKKGDCLGYFKMGSTVLAFWEANSVDLEDLNATKVNFGNIIATKRS